MEMVIDDGVFYQSKETDGLDTVDSFDTIDPFGLMQPAVVDEDGVTTIEGDIMIEGIPEDQKTPSELATRSRRKVTGGLWPDNIVPWKINESLPPYSATAMRRIKLAMDWWETNTCIRFVPADTRPRHKPLVIDNEKACSSFVGYQSSSRSPYQRLRLWERRCISSSGTPAHEFGHALGLIHEHSREDRDDYIDVNPNNIDATVIGNYKKSYSSDIPEGVGYDLASIMHYSGRVFTSKIPSKQALMGQRKALGFYDIKAINMKYQCGGECRNRCENDGYPHLSNGRCICICPEGLTGASCEKVDSSCGSVIHLKSGDSVKIASPNYPHPASSKHNKCWWLVKAPAGHFIEMKFYDLDVASTASSWNRPAKCIDQVEIRNNLMGQKGYMFCGDGEVKPFNTELGQLKDTMLVGLDLKSKKNDRGRGFTATVTAYQDGCASNPCQNGGTCESDRTSSVNCYCRDGYSGKLCDEVTDGAVDCDFSEGMCGLVNAYSDQLDFYRGFLFSKYGEKLERFSNGNKYFISAPVEWTTKESSEAKVRTQSSFSASARKTRCLTFYSRFEGDAWQNGELNVRLIDPRTAKPIKTLTTLTKKNGGYWRRNQIQISQSNDYKIEFSFKTSKNSIYNSLVGIDDISVTPQRCSGSPCSSNPCSGEGSVCVETQSNSYRCLCAPGRTGKRCKSIITSDAKGVECSFDSNELCGWTQDKSDHFDWIRTQGASDARQRTGPTTAVKGSGYYMVTDTSHSKALAGSVARLVSPPLLYKGDLCVEFYYHMYGVRKVGSLSLKMKQSGRVQPQSYFEKVGSQSKDWIYARVNVPVTSANAKLVFEATTGTRHLSDIAIDDIKMTRKKC